MSNSNENIFQLSVLSQDDPSAADGDKLVCIVSKITGGELRSNPFLLNEEVKLPIPPVSGKPTPETPTWFLIRNSESEESSFTLEIFCPEDPTYPIKQITVKASDVAKWAKIPYDKRENQIYQEGKYGIFGFAQEEGDYLIYTVTAGVLDPKKHG